MNQLYEFTYLYLIIPFEKVMWVCFVCDWIPFGVGVEDPNEGEPRLTDKRKKPNKAMKME